MTLAKTCVHYWLVSNDSLEQRCRKCRKRMVREDIEEPFRLVSAPKEKARKRFNRYYKLLPSRGTDKMSRVG